MNPYVLSTLLAALLVEDARRVGHEVETSFNLTADVDDQAAKQVTYVEAANSPETEDAGLEIFEVTAADGAVYRVTVQQV